MDLKLMLNEELQIITITNLEINLFIQDFLLRKQLEAQRR